MWTSLLAATGALALLTVLPGPDVAVVTRTTLVGGRSGGVRCAAGIGSGLIVWGLLTVAGLAALLAASATAYTVVRLAGAAYLLWLGVRALLGTRHTDEDVPVPHNRRPWRTGFTTNVLNPKIAVFYTGVLPGLAPAALPEVAALALLVGIHVVLTLVWLTAYAVTVHRASVTLRRPRIRRMTERITGAALLGFGTKVALSVRAG